MTQQEQYWKERCVAAEELIRHICIVNKNTEYSAEIYENWRRVTKSPAPLQGVEEGLVMFDSIDHEFVEIQTIEEGIRYVRENYVDGDSMHSDFYSFDVYKKVGDVHVSEDKDGNATGIYSRWQQGQGYSYELLEDAHCHGYIDGGKYATNDDPIAEKSWKQFCYDKSIPYEEKEWSKDIPINTTPDTDPTIGARWVREEIERRISYLKKADAEVCKERWDITQSEFARLVARDTSNFLTERRHELEDLLKMIPADEFSSTFPTTEEAEKWARKEWPTGIAMRKAALAMYDWIKTKLKIMTYEEACKKAKTVRWKVSFCNQGEACWCRLIVPEEPIFDNNGEEIIISNSGNIRKEYAELIVDDHNKNL